MATQQRARKTKAVRKPMKAAKKPARRTQQATRTSAARTITPRAVRLTTVNDAEGVRQVLSRYCHALDRGNLDEVGALFHRDAVFAVSFESGQQHTGRDTIQGWYEQFFRARPGQFRHMRHKIFEPLIHLSGTTATTSTYFDADSVAEDASVRVISGRYDDIVVKERGQWFFKQRTITVFYHYSVGNCQEGM